MEAVAVCSFETSAIVEEERQIIVSGVPFEPGTEVEVTISPRRRSAVEFAAAWRNVCAAMRRAWRAVTV